jgi:hypothetical protein
MVEDKHVEVDCRRRSGGESREAGNLGKHQAEALKLAPNIPPTPHGPGCDELVLRQRTLAIALRASKDSISSFNA